MLPRANTGAMQMHLDEISRNVATRAHAVVLMDRAGWHKTDKLKVPKNLSIILLPSRAPELNPVENVWQYLRQNWLSNRVFEDYQAILDAGCQRPTARVMVANTSLRTAFSPKALGMIFKRRPSSRNRRTKRFVARVARRLSGRNGEQYRSKPKIFRV
jgi:transposase